MKLPKLLTSFVGLSIPAILLISSAIAQNTNASLSGVVVDASQALIPGATIVVTNANTGASRKATSDSRGHYLVLDLNPGTYRIDATHDGFDKKVMSGIVLQVGQAAALDIPMAVGDTGTTVTVTSSEVAVTETQSASQGSVIDNVKIIGLPLNQRTFYSLPLLTPGVEMPAQNSTLGFRGGFNVAGNEETSNTFTVNGVDDNDQDVMAPSFRPSVEDIEEFNILTGVYSAEYGRTQGGQVVVVTKSGGNQFHGDAFEFIRNQATDAKNYFTLPGATPGFRRNQFGGTLGGPIVKDHTFFFFSYEQMALAQQVSATSTVPTVNERSGNFAGVATIHDPYTGRPFTTPNQIPAGAMSTFGRDLMSLYPLPNNGTGTSNNYLFSETRTENSYTTSVRIDDNLSASDTLVGQFNYFDDPSFEPSNSLCSASTLPGFGCTTNQISTLAGINWVHIFNSNLLNEFRAGYDRLVQPRLQQDSTNTSFPLLAGVFNDPSISNNFGSPATTVSGFTSLAPYGNLPQNRWDNHYNLIDNLTWTHGAHQIKGGVNLLDARYSNSYVVNGRGALTFNSSSSASAGGPTTGNSLADLLYGIPYSTSREATAPRLEMLYGSYGAFLEDTWRASKSLTFNLGLRYEYFTPLEDRNNRIANYDPTTETMLQAGAPGVGKRVFRSDTRDFEPRLGASWQPFHKPTTVVHAAAGMFYNSPSVGNGAGLALYSNAPMRAPQTFYTSTATPLQLDTNPFQAPAGCSLNQVGVTANCPLTITPTGIQRNFKIMYATEYSLDVQRQLATGLALTVGYQGSTGARLPNEANLNQPYVVNGVSASTRPVLGVHGITYPSVYYYSYNNISYYMSEGTSHFNSLQVKLQQQYQHGLSLLFAYTWSKSIDTTPGYASTSQSSALLPQNSYNPGAEKGLSDFNVAQRMVISPVYDLPFGKGRAYLTHGIRSMLAGGFQFSGIGTIETGRPFTVYNANLNNSGSFNNEDRPNLISTPNNGPKTVQQWFNTAAFSTAVPKGTFGNAGRNLVIGPGYVDVDMAVQRSFQLGEKVTMPVRFESFDVANKPNFFAPSGSSLQDGTSSFGTISQANDPREMQLSVKFIF